MNKILVFLILTFCFLSCEQTQFTQGQRIYAAKCANCHMEDGSGLKKLIPSLANSQYIKGDKTSIICIIKNGKNADSLGITEKYMPSHKKMREVELTNLVNYLQEKFNEGSYQYKISEVAELSKKCNIE